MFKIKFKKNLNVNFYIFTFTLLISIINFLRKRPFTFSSRIQNISFKLFNVFFNIFEKKKLYGGVLT